ncbi:MAG: hypothetical protein GX153_06130, partial [Clostridiaceae bacterium]|nr:hypothetical protein [Clostridiaceae bacterium]
MAATLDTLLRGRKKVPLRTLAVHRDAAERGLVDFSTDIQVVARDLSLWYGETLALDRINLDIRAREITALIGPSGCGKS